jgi:hypothetical protein
MPAFLADTLASVDDFRNSGWADAVASSDGSLHDIWHRLSLAARASVDAGQSAKAKVLSLLADASSLSLRPEKVTEWFQPGVVASVGRSISPSEFTPEDLALVGEIAREITNDALRARLSDLVWLLRKPKDPADALRAIDAYRATPLTGAAWVIEGRLYWERAFVLCRMLGKGCGDRETECEATLTTAFEGATTADGFLALWFSEVLVNCRLAGAAQVQIATRLETMSREFDQSGEVERARLYAEGAIVWLQKAGKLTKADELTAFLAETWAKEASAKASSTPPLNAVAASFYEQAIQIYRMIPRKRRAALNVEDRLADLHRLMTEAGENSLQEMGRVQSEGVSLADLIDRTVAAVRGQELGMAMKALTSGKTSKVSERRARAEASLQTFSLRRLFASTHLSSDGRVVAKVPPIDVSDHSSTKYQSVLWAEMLTHYRVEVQVAVHAIILPALEIILLEHRITESELVELAYASSAVPQGRELLFARGLLAGFDRDFATAIHVLAPQVEHLMRWHLKAAGIRTTTLDADGIETENGLSTLMALPETSKMFGEDLAFEIKAIFCEPLAGNLRNEIAHGLLSFPECTSVWSVYAWWLVLRMVLMAFWNSQRRAPETNEKRD